MNTRFQTSYFYFINVLRKRIFQPCLDFQLESCRERFFRTLILPYPTLQDSISNSIIISLILINTNLFSQKDKFTSMCFTVEKFIIQIESELLGHSLCDDKHVTLAHNLFFHSVLLYKGINLYSCFTFFVLYM